MTTRMTATALFCLLALCATPLRAQTPSRADAVVSTIDLGSLGGIAAYAVAVSELGHVVGISETPFSLPHAFLWTEAGGMRDLGTLAYLSQALDVNDYGEVVGLSQNAAGDERPFLWTEESGMVELPTPGYQHGQARAINNAGTIVGVAYGPRDGAFAFAAMSWTRDGEVTELGGAEAAGHSPYGLNTFGEASGEAVDGIFRWSRTSGYFAPGIPGIANRINDRGDMAGSTNQEAFLWTDRDGLTRLGTLSGVGYSQAIGLNNLRQAVGWSDVDSGPCVAAFIWRSRTGMVRLPSGCFGSSGSYAFDISDQGVIAGGRADSDGIHAVIWQLSVPATDIARAIRVRIDETTRRGLLKRGPSRALTAKLDQVDGALRRRGGNALPHASALRKQIASFARDGVLGAALALPLTRLATVLQDKVR